MRLIRRLGEGDVMASRLQTLFNFNGDIPVTLRSQPVTMESATMTTITAKLKNQLTTILCASGFFNVLN